MAGSDEPLDELTTPLPGSVSRRAFLASVGAAAAGASALASGTGTGIAEAAAEPASTEVGSDFEYLYRNTPLGEPIPTSVQVADAGTLDGISGLGRDFQRVTDPVAGAYVRLTREEAVEVYQTDGVEAMRFAPGANPFWQLDSYPGRVFPDSSDALDYIAYEEALAGIDALEAAHPSMVNVRTVGQSPGHTDVVTGEPEAYDVTVVEVTNDVDDDAAMAAKEKVLCSLGIHGDERAGVEAGLRFLEDVLEGDEPDVASTLDDVAILFVMPNPDGWASRSELTDVSGASSTFKRENASGVDPNRQYPTVGYIDPDHNPADPNGSNLADDDPGIDDDVDDRYTGTVPDSLGVVEALREYENYAFAADFHGMFGSENFVEGLLMNDQYQPEEHAKLDALNEAIDASFEETVAPLMDANEAALREGADARAPRTRGIPENPYEYGTILDTIGYTTTGGFGSWFSDALESGGIDATGVSFEMSLDNRNGGRMSFIPGLNEVQVVAYATCMREMVRQTARNLDGSIDAQGRSVAYVDTNVLTRSSTDLNVDPATSVAHAERVVAVPADGTVVSLDDVAAEASVGADVDVDGDLHVRVQPENGREVRARLFDPAGETYRDVETVGGGFQSGSRVSVSGAEPGRWRLSLAPDAPTTVTVRTTRVVADGAPSPAAALGYDQRPYEVSPLDYLDAYGDALQGESMRSESVNAVANGALLSSGSPVVDALVVPHDDGANDRSYVNALEAFVDAGGQLVLTDSGLNLLESLDAGGASPLGSSDVRQVTRNAATFDNKEQSSLLDGVRRIEREIWKATPLGYDTRGECEMSLVDASAFQNAGGSVAATTSRDVALGELDRITVVGSLLPPAGQSNLHPFGLYAAAVSSMGHQILVNALGHAQAAVSGGESR